MKKTKVFDTLIVYNHDIASSASTDAVVPFENKSQDYNQVYAYFLETCKAMNMTAALTTSADFKNGKFKSFWVFENNKWIKVQKTCVSNFIFDKFAPTSKKRRNVRASLFDHSLVKPFNHPKIYNLFIDKQNTYDQLPEYSIPTVSINSNTQKDIRAAINKLETLISSHHGKKDFSSDLVLKDRHGAGGNNIYIIKKDNSVKKLQTILSANPSIKFVIQPFTKFQNGYRYKNYSGFIDIRIIFLDGKAIQTYLRIATENDFRCNEHMGGTLEYISIKELPPKVLDLSKRITKRINVPNSLYALDFIISDYGNIYLIEGNSGPGLDWNVNRKENEKKSKQLIRAIVKNISKRIKSEDYTDKRITQDGLMTTPLSLHKPQANI